MSRGPWERRKPPEYHGASEFEKLQWVCGIPTRFWNTGSNSVHPATFTYEGAKGGIERIPAARQEEYLKARIEQPELMESNRFVCMTSHPSDDHALAAACLLATAFIDKTRAAQRPIRVRVDDIQDYEKSLKLDRTFYAADPDMLVLYNFNPNSSRERLSLLRDLLNDNEGIYRVVVAAADNPFQFARESLYMEPHEVYHFEGKPRKVIQQ